MYTIMHSASKRYKRFCVIPLPLCELTDDAIIIRNGNIQVYQPFPVQACQWAGATVKSCHYIRRQIFDIKQMQDDGWAVVGSFLH